MNKLLVILGPTSTGKTDLALQLASKVKGELVSADSRQVYKGLDIGTGKMSGKELSIKKKKNFWEVNGVKIWMYDVVSPKRQYTVYDYVNDANRAIREIEGRKKLPIVVGGTGLYLKALLEGLPNLAIPVDQRLREQLLKLSKEELQQKLQRLSPKRWQKMNDSDRENPRRLIRSIELETSPRRSSFDFAQDHLRGDTAFHDVLKIGLTAPREVLYKRVGERVVERIAQGMIEEAQNLHRAGLSFKRMRQLGLEYGVLADYLEGKLKSKEKLIEIMQYKIHGYVRRQFTWFKNPSTSSGSIHWFDITSRNYVKEVANCITKWYYQS